LDDAGGGGGVAFGLSRRALRHGSSWLDLAINRLKGAFDE
jgi:hypothetical protein